LWKASKLSFGNTHVIWKCIIDVMTFKAEIATFFAVLVAFRKIAYYLIFTAKHLRRNVAKAMHYRHRKKHKE